MCARPEIQLTPQDVFPNVIHLVFPTKNDIYSISLFGQFSTNWSYIIVKVVISAAYFKIESVYYY